MIDVANYKRLTADQISTEGLLNLVCGFITAVSNEYLSALDEYMHNKNIKESRNLYNNVRSYILSDHFSNMTNMDGNYMIEQLDIMYKKGFRVV